MTEIVLFHHVQGLTDGVRAFAGELSARGHAVHTPDLFEGKTFGTIDEGLAHVREVGFSAVLQRGIDAAAGLPGDVVYAGFSLGVMPAQRLVQTSPEALGGLFFSGFVTPDDLGSPWRDDVPVQVHAMDQDPFFVDEGDIDAARAVQAEHSNLEIVLYPGAGHLFADSTSPDYDSESAALLLDRSDTFLNTLPR